MKTVPGQSLQSSITKGLLQDYHDISNLECITEYFKRLYHLEKMIWIKEYYRRIQGLEI